MPKTWTTEIEEILEVEPDWDDHLVPRCSGHCRQHDGRRCRIMCQRPTSLCDGSCGACNRYVAEGHQCRLDCERVPEATRERVRELIARGASEDEIREEMAWLT